MYGSFEVDGGLSCALGLVPLSQHLVVEETF
jgi:hypothetical protein